MTGVRWQEHFDGWLGRGSIRDADFNEALLSGQRHPATMSIDVYYDDVDRWIRDPSYAGRVDGGRLVCDGIAVANNRNAFERIKLRHRALVDVSGRTINTTLFGKPVSMPLARTLPRRSSFSKTSRLASATADDTGCPANVMPCRNVASPVRNGSISSSRTIMPPSGE